MAVAAFAVIAAVLMIQSNDSGSVQVVPGSVSVVPGRLVMQTAFTPRYAAASCNGGG